MLPEAPDAAHLWDMLDAARAVTEFVSGRNLEDYVRDRMLRIHLGEMAAAWTPPP